MGEEKQSERMCNNRFRWLSTIKPGLIGREQQRADSLQRILLLLLLYYDVLQCRRITSSDWREGHCACAYDRLKLSRRVFDRFVYDTITVLIHPPLK